MTTTRAGVAFGVACAAAVSVSAAVSACESAANLDVQYVADAAAADGPSGFDADDAGSDAQAIFEACPCDSTAGLGCCVTRVDAFCTDDEATCARADGILLRCSRHDPTTESECCWHGGGAGASTARAAFCDGGPSACVVDSDCAGTGRATCQKTVCGPAKIELGACADRPPSCP